MYFAATRRYAPPYFCADYAFDTWPLILCHIPTLFLSSAVLAKSSIKPIKSASIY
jgi:hypothetical protein